MLDFQLSTILFTIINLLILYLFLRKFFFGRVNAVLEQRQNLIQEQLDTAETQKKQAQELEQQYQQKLSGVQQEVAAILSDAKNQAQKMYDEQMAQAQAQTRQLETESEARLANQRQEMLRSVRKEVAQLAVLAASQVARQELDQDTDRAMVDQFLSEAGEQP